MQAKPSRSSRIVAVRMFTALAAIALAASLLGGALAPRGDAAATISARLVKDINPDSAVGSAPDNLAVFNGELYFSADDGTGTYGRELWKSDGTTAGTVMVKDINPGTTGSNPNGFTAFNGSLYFQAGADADGFQLWKTDGTATGTVMVATTGPTGGGSYPSGLTVAGGKLYFAANDGTHGIELWVSDGVVDTTDNTHTFMVKDINTGPSGSTPSDSSLCAFAGCTPSMVAFNNKLYFVATDGGIDVGNELWMSNGTNAGTVPVTNISADSGNSDPYNLTPLGNWLYFAANDGTQGTQLYRTDGTPDTAEGDMQPIKLIKTSGDANANPGGTYDQPEGFGVYNDNLYFSADDGINGIEPWKSNGTSAGTNMLKDINITSDYGGSSFPLWFTAWNGSLYFQAVDGPQSSITHYTELWKSDGTESGTNMLKDINTGSTAAAGSDPRNFTAFNGSLYFVASDGNGSSNHGTELWKTDGTAAGTVLAADIKPGGGSSYPAYLTAVGNNLLFIAEDSAHGQELWEAGDYSPPETQIDSGPSGTVTSTSASFSFSADEAATFECSFDGAAMSACTSPKSFSGLAIGSHTFQVQATDLVGNVDASPASRSFTVAVATTTTTTGTTPPPPPPSNPQTTITKHPKKVVSTSASMASASFKFTSSKKGSHFSCKLDKGKWASCRSPKAYNVKPGKHTFQVRATSAGKTDPTPAKWTWTVKRS